MTAFVSPDRIRGLFAQAMSDMYRAEVPLYGDLITLVGDINTDTQRRDPALAQRLRRTGETERLDLERHGAIRVGTPAELAMLGRVFALMGMHPVGYYDLTVAGVPVHATAFRPLTEAALAANPFRIFTSLLRLELIADAALRAEAEAIPARRDIFTPMRARWSRKPNGTADWTTPMRSASSPKCWKPSAGMAMRPSRWRPTTRCTACTAWWPTWSASAARTSTTSPRARWTSTPRRPRCWNAASVPRR